MSDYDDDGFDEYDDEDDFERPNCIRDAGKDLQNWQVVT
eukprot:gene1604-32993_t